MKNLAQSTSTAADAALAQADIGAVLQRYETALNAADTDTVLSVFAPDGVFMASNSPAAVGSGAIRAAYQAIFQTIRFDTELSVEEIVPITADWAFARTHSSGHVTVTAVQQRVPDANHELFIFHKTAGGAWKIARYAFATTNPLPR